MTTPSIHTQLFVAAFLVLYLAVLVRKTQRSHLDVYDFGLLSLVAILPATFVLAPRIAFSIAHFVGVEFPFVVMFGALFFVVFVSLYRSARATQALRQRTIHLAQELALLQERVSRKTG